MANEKSLASSTLEGGKKTTAHQQEGYKSVCAKCGATRIDAQIGLESTPAAYVANIVSVMRECWRVLKDDGILWLNLGDSYVNNGVSDPSKVGGFNGDRIRRGVKGTMDSRPKSIPDGLKPKDLCGIPWRVAFALQDDGWYLRSDIIWHKPNPMPESVTDRPTKAHEYVFLLTKQARYYYDAEAIKESAQDRPLDSWEKRKGAGAGSGSLENGHNSSIAKGDGFTHNLGNGSGRNRRSVWTVATSPYSGAHFATFPPLLIEPMILAGSRRGDMVLDPFAGTATVGRVCAKHGRQFIGTELNLKYIDLADERTSSVQQAMGL